MAAQRKPALLVIDMIEDFAKGTSDYERRFQETAEKIRDLGEKFRLKGYPVIYICDSHGPEDFELTKWGIHAMAGTRGAEVVQELQPKEGDFVVHKKTYNAFFETGLSELLEKLQAGPLILTGVLTDICVHYSAVHAFYLGYKVYLPRECMTSFTESAHEAALQSMQTCAGEVVTTEELVDVLKL